MIKITFPDKSVREYEQGVTGLQKKSNNFSFSKKLFCSSKQYPFTQTDSF